MILRFEHIGPWRYAVRAQRPGLTDLVMAPAPGYDPLMPHDLLHLAVEAQLRLNNGIFGQLAAGGDAATFHPISDGAIHRRAHARTQRRTIKRGKKRKGRDDSFQSERATYICWYEWLARSALPERRKQAKAMGDTANHIRSIASLDEMRRLDEKALTRICRHLDELSSHWRLLHVGESVSVRWPDLVVVTRRASGLQPLYVKRRAEH